MIFINRQSPLFDKKKAKQGFEKNIKELDFSNDNFESISDSDEFWNVYEDGYVGTIFVYEGTSGKNLIGGYAERKRFKEIVKAIKTVAKGYKTLYAETEHRNAVLVLLRAGFKKFNNILRYTNG